MEREGRSLGSMDMMTGAHAVAIDAILGINDKALTLVDSLRASVNWATDL